MQFLFGNHNERLRSTLLDDLCGIADLDLAVQELCAMLMADETTPLFFVNVGVPDFEAPEFQVPTYVTNQQGQQVCTSQHDDKLSGAGSVKAIALDTRSSPRSTMYHCEAKQ